MIYVLDTDILSLLAHRDSPEAPRIRRRIAELPSEDTVVTTIINYEEQMRGWVALLSQAKSSKAEVQIYGRLASHLATFRRMTVLEYSAAASNIVDEFRRQKLKIGSMDLKIAAIATSVGAVLVTRNISDFCRIPGMRLQDWTTE